jgi:sulfonate transport system substrate-binding protein
VSQTFPSSPFRYLVSSIAVQLCLLGAAGCDKGRAEPLPNELSATSSGLERITIKFSEPGNSGVLAYAKREGILERELAKVNASIEWVPAAGAFSANFDAMNSGAMNASAGAISPVVGALAHNLEFRIFAIGDPSDMRQAGIVSPAGSNIKRVEDLVGKRVAVNFAAHGDYILLKALADRGISFDSVTRIPIQPPDAAAAFATGKIDAWSTFGVFFATAVQNGANVIAREAELNSDDVTITSANVAVLRKNPAAFQVFIRVQAELAREAREHPEKFVNVFTDKGPTATTGDRLAIAIEEARSTPIQHAPTPADRTRVANVAKLFVEAKSIDRPLEVDNIVFDVDVAANAKVAEVPR